MPPSQESGIFYIFTFLHILETGKPYSIRLQSADGQFVYYYYYYHGENFTFRVDMSSATDTLNFIVIGQDDP